MNRLKKILKNMDSVLVAYSGGVDSSFLLKLSKDVLDSRVIAVTAASETYPKSELKNAIKTAKKLRARHLVINTSELEINNFKDNPVDRCYYCKKELFSKLLEIAKKNKMNYVLDASNYDDLKDRRPGAKAAEELGIRSPLKEARLTKSDIRFFSKRLGLDTWNKPSSACLASRFPYGSRITKQKLNTVGRAEDYLRNLGLSQLRVRHHGNIARIEVEQTDFLLAVKNSSKINNQFKKFGFRYAALDLGGYRTGSMNEVLT